MDTEVQESKQEESSLFERDFSSWMSDPFFGGREQENERDVEELKRVCGVDDWWYGDDNRPPKLRNEKYKKSDDFCNAMLDKFYRGGGL